MKFRQILDEAALTLDHFLDGGTLATTPVLRGGPDLSRKLLAAGVAFLNSMEIWYELELQPDASDTDQVSLVFRAISETAAASAAASAMKVVISFGPSRYQMKLDSQGRAAWSVPLHSIQDRWTKRTMTPVVLVLSDE